MWALFGFGVAFNLAAGDSAVRGVGMLLCYSLGLGIPFVVATMLLDHLKGALAAVKENYQLINRICGILLIVLGL